MNIVTHTTFQPSLGFKDVLTLEAQKPEISNNINCQLIDFQTLLKV